MSKEVIIVSTKRTPIRRFLGSLSRIPVPKLGAATICNGGNRASAMVLEHF